MTQNTQQEPQKKPWLPYTIGGAGIIISILLWYILTFETTSETCLDTITSSFPWIILLFGTFISLLLALVIGLSSLIKERKWTLDQINSEFKNEIAERIHAEETKQNLERALLQGQKLQAIGTLAGGIAHDFNNLLYAILGFVEMAREDVEKDSLLYNNLGKVLQAAHRGQELIARILAFSRRQHHELKPICLKETVEGVLGLLKPTIPASVSISFIVNLPDSCYILGNETLLHQIIVNIINNAVDAMDGEGTVTIKISHILPNDELLEQFPNIDKVNYCKIEISDTGHGMDQATKERIFEPFFTTKEVGKGTGLGLATVHAIVEEHDGRTMVVSQLGRGTTFTILLPEYIE